MILPLPALFTLALALLTRVQGQDIVFDAEHNATNIVGTWSSGSQAVMTGSVCLFSPFPPKPIS